MLQKLFSFIKSLFSKPKEVEVVPLPQRTTEELCAEWTKTKNEIRDLEDIHLKPLREYLWSLNSHLFQRFTELRDGDIVQVRRKNGVDFTYVIEYILYDPNVVYPIPQVKLFCRAFHSKKHGHEIAKTQTIFGETSNTMAHDPMKIIDIFKLRSINQPAAKLK